MKKYTLITLLLVLMMTILAACGMNQSPACSLGIKLTDGLNRTVCLAAPAQRIVSLAPSATEILYAVGAGDQVVGRDTFSDYPDAAKSVTDVGGSQGNYSYETIKFLNPDLVIAAGINTPDQVKTLENLGLTVYYIANPKDFDGLFTIIKNVGKLSGHDKDAASLVDSLNIRVETVKTLVARTVTKPVVFYELDGSDPSKPWTTGPGTFMDMLIKTAGGTNVGSSLKGDWAQISIEDLILKNPDLIVLGDAAYGTTAAQVASRNGWGDIKAIKNHKVFEINDDLVSLAGPRLVDGLEILVSLIHPEMFRATTN